MKIISKLKAKQENSREQRIQALAKEVFQVKEHEKELWFVHHGNLFCPCKMICNEEKIVEYLNKFRELYAERKFNG